MLFSFLLLSKFYTSPSRNSRNGVISRGEATKNLLHNNDLRLLAYTRNNKILNFAEFIIYNNIKNIILISIKKIKFFGDGIAMFQNGFDEYVFR